jgi:hypothetical protein
MGTGYLRGNPKTDGWEDHLKWILKKEDFRPWTGLIWLR